MTTMIFVNLPVKNLKKSMDFFYQLGFNFNAQFTDENAACMIINDDAYIMLLNNEFFQTFTPNKIGDANKASEVLLSISADSRAKVDELVRKAVEAGGKIYKDPDDRGMMYSQSFQDLDGHIWEAVWMDPSAIRPVEFVAHKSEKVR